MQNEGHPVLPDVLANDLDIVFCGTAAGRKSAEVRAYYAGSGNKFWPTLHAVGLTPERISPPRYREVLGYKMGLTDVAKYAYGPDSQLREADFDASAAKQRLRCFRPRILAFTSKRAASAFMGSPVDYGLMRERFEDITLFTLASPSGLAARYWGGGELWHELAELANSIAGRTLWRQRRCAAAKRG